VKASHGYAATPKSSAAKASEATSCGSRVWRQGQQRGNNSKRGNSRQCPIGTHIGRWSSDKANRYED